MKSRAEVEERVLELLELRTLPATVERLLVRLSDPEVSIIEVARMIQSDPVLASRVLKLANSAFYRGSGGVDSLSDAALRMGLTTLRNLVLTVSAFDALAPEDLEGFDLSSFWRHSFATSLFCVELAPTESREDRDASALAGLLHDIGILALLNIFPTFVGRIVRLGVATFRPFEMIERTFFEIGHAEVGAILVENWNFPEQYVVAIRDHHEPEPSTALGKLVRHGDMLAAAYLSRELGPPESLTDDFFDECGMTRDEVEAPAERMSVELQTIAESMGW